MTAFEVACVIGLVGTVWLGFRCVCRLYRRPRRTRHAEREALIAARRAQIHSVKFPDERDKSPRWGC